LETTVTQAAGSRQPQTEAPDAAPLNHRVLIAEDEALIRLDLAEMLREEGYQVIAEAGDGASAIELARDLRPNLVIMDIKMPKVDGISAAAVIVEERIAPVVMLTAFSQRDLVERARDAGAMAYLVKPFQKRDLLPAVEIATSRFAEIKALESEVHGLRERLEARKLIERAKGALMSTHAMSEPEAFRWIQRAAMDNRTTMRAVAQVVLSGAEPGPAS
jgi:response regulator NasT